MAGALPEDMSSEDDDNSDRDYGPPDPHDDDDFGHGGGAPTQARPLDPLGLVLAKSFLALSVRYS